MADRRVDAYIRRRGLSVTDRTPAQTDARLGVFTAVGAYALWGVLPIYLKAVGFADSFEILAERILFSIPAAAIVIGAMSGWRRGWRELRAALTPRMLGTLTLSALLILCNWGIYVWAVGHGHLMESALAYFLAPLGQVVVGVIFFGERLRGAQKIALGFAALGVIVQGVALGAPPWIAIILCASWVGYAIVRRRAPVAGATGLVIEAILLAPLAIAALFWLAHGPGLKFNDSLSNGLLLTLSGPATAAPLILFAIAVRRISFATLGLLQYIAPSLQFLLGVFYGEPLSPLRIVSFALIWLGLAAFVWDSFIAYRAAKAVQTEA